MSNPFPLLLVPHVIFRELLKSMDFVDIVNLSRCSQKSKQIARNNLFRLKDWTISVVSNKGIFLRKEYVVGKKGIFLQKEYERERCIWDVSNFNTQIIPTHNDGLISHPKTESDRELEKATEYVTYLFRSDIHTIDFGNCGAWLLKWVNERGAKISQIFFCESRQNELNCDVLGYVLRESRAENVMVNGGTKYSFKYTGPFGDFDYFFQVGPRWMTVECLISMKCSRTIVPFTQLTNADLNRLLKHFVNGGSSQWEWMTIGIWGMNEEEILLGLEEYIRRTDNKRVYQWKGDLHIYVDATYTFKGLEIVTKNGVIASLDFRIDDNEFRMAVWPRS